MKRAPLTYRRRTRSKQSAERLREIERDFHVRAFGEELARVNFDLTIEERHRYLDWMRELARKSGVPLQRTLLAAGFLIVFITSRAAISALVLFLAAGASPALCQTNLAYAWTNFVGQPGFGESTDGPDTLANTGSADGSGSTARFYHPRGVAVDDSGNLFVADTGNHTIRKVTPDGVVTTLAGGPGAKGTNGDTGGAAPVFGLDGEPVDGPGASGTNDGVGRAALFYRPESVTVDRAGNVFVADMMNNTIRKVTAAGVVTTLAGYPSVWPPRGGFATGSAPSTHQPYGATEYRTGYGFLAHAADDGTGSSARFYNPSSVAVDRDGNVFVSDAANNRIRKVTPAGVVTTLAGGPRSLGDADGTGSAARFNFPMGVAVDNAGNVFVADNFNHTIRRVSPVGVVTTLAGNASIKGLVGAVVGPVGGYADGTGKAARFHFPQGLAVDSTGNVFVADSWNSAIRKITPAGVVTTIGGTPGVAGWTDGVGTSAQFCDPCGIAVDKAGRVYVADSGNNRISKGTPIHP